MIETLLGIVFGCFFSHAGRWELPVKEPWKRTTIAGEKENYEKTVQFRTCLRCGARERRVVNEGIQ